MKEIAPAIIVAWKEFARLKNKRSRAEKWTRFENEYKERANHLNKEGISEEKGSRFTFHVPKNLRGND